VHVWRGEKTGVPIHSSTTCIRDFARGERGGKEGTEEGREGRGEGEREEGRGKKGGVGGRGSINGYILSTLAFPPKESIDH